MRCCAFPPQVGINVGVVVFFAVRLVQEFIAMAKRELDRDNDGSISAQVTRPASITH